MNWTIAKLQTFGCEVEMNHIGRKQAAVIAAEYFGTNNWRYSGGGYDTYTAFDERGRKWNFMTDASICGDHAQRCEMVTPILTYDDDMELLQGLIRKLRGEGAISTPAQGCGVHIHIGADGHDGKSLRNLANLMASKQDLLINALGISEFRVSKWCKRIDREFLKELNNKRPTSKEGVQDIWYETATDRSERTEHYHGSRYRMLNYHALQKGTVEFRMFNFDNPTAEKKNGLHAGQLRAWVMLALAISQEAKDKRSISATPVQDENEKFAMRTWMNRMGMIGPEFKEPREHLTKRLSGNAAWRYGENH